MTQADAVLRQVYVKTSANQKNGQKTLIVFDLDSTLFDVSPRIQKILEHYYEKDEHKAQFPEYSQHFVNIKAKKTDWGVKQALIRAGLTEASTEFVDSVRSFWRKHFFSNDYLKFDHPSEGAVDYVKALWEAGAKICYLTGRDVDRMGVGTAEILQKWGFPLGERAELYLKPHKSMDDIDYKKAWFEKLSEDDFADVWFFENEPSIIHQVRLLSFVKIIFFDSTHSGRAEPPTDLPTITHFDWKK